MLGDGFIPRHPTERGRGSSGHEFANGKYRRKWKSSTAPARHRRLVQPELPRFRSPIERCRQEPANTRDRQTTPEKKTRRMARRPLLRILGLTFGLAVILGGTIGVGILRTPYTVAAELGSRTLILTVWTLGGLYTLIGAQ